MKQAMELIYIVILIFFFLAPIEGGIPNSRAISFPGEPQAQAQAQETRTHSFRVKKAPACHLKQASLHPEHCLENGTLPFCQDDEQYDGLIQKRFLDLLASTDAGNMMGLISNEILVDPSDIMPDTRQFSQEVPACVGRETLIFPKRAQTVSNDWVFVLNQPNLQQGVRVEVCHSEGGQCRIGTESGVKTTCRQKYIYKKMLTMDANGAKIVPESVYLPSCCVCYIQDFGQLRIDEKMSC